MRKSTIITLVFFTCLLWVYGVHLVIGEQSVYIQNVTFVINYGSDDPSYDPIEHYSPLTTLLLWGILPGSIVLSYYVITRLWDGYDG
jgi:hypothetical protein